jgi:hypothetical protein
MYIFDDFKPASGIGGELSHALTCPHPHHDFLPGILVSDGIDRGELIRYVGCQNVLHVAQVAALHIL